MPPSRDRDIPTAEATPVCVSCLTEPTISTAGEGAHSRDVSMAGHAHLLAAVRPPQCRHPGSTPRKPWEGLSVPHAWVLKSWASESPVSGIRGSLTWV